MDAPHHRRPGCADNFGKTCHENFGNRQERAIREAVVIRKIVGTLRNSEGAKVFARQLRVNRTWKLQGEDPTNKLVAVLT